MSVRQNKNQRSPFIRIELPFGYTILGEKESAIKQYNKIRNSMYDRFYKSSSDLEVGNKEKKHTIVLIKEKPDYISPQLTYNELTPKEVDDIIPFITNNNKELLETLFPSILNYASTSDLVTKQKPVSQQRKSPSTQLPEGLKVVKPNNQIKGQSVKPGIPYTTENGILKPLGRASSRRNTSPPTQVEPIHQEEPTKPKKDTWAEVRKNKEPPKSIQPETQTPPMMLESVGGKKTK